MFDPSDWPLLALLAFPIAVAGVIVRGRGRRNIERVLDTTLAVRSLRDLQQGVVVFAGSWRAVGRDGRGVIEDDGAAALIDRGAGAPPIVDGARVLCRGVAGGDAPDPRGGGYRSSGRLTVVDASGAGDFVTTETDRLSHLLRASKRDAIVGAMLVAVSVAWIVAGVALWLRAE
jgi:hypothetical protein